MAAAKKKAGNAKAPEGSDDDSTSSNRTVDRTSALDTYIPIIRRVNEADLIARFTLERLTPFVGEPTFASMQRAEEELAANALTSQVSFGGGDSGCLGVVYNNAKFHAETGKDWIVPKTQGPFPIITPGLTEQEKKVEISSWMIDEYDLKIVKAMGNLLKNQLIAAVDEGFILELKKGISGYNSCTLLEILAHLRKNYAVMDDAVYNELMTRFREPPNFDEPIDIYFQKQHKCKLLSQDSIDPITDGGLVIQLTTHMSASGLINSSVTKFKNLPLSADKTWEKAKAWMRRALKEKQTESKLEGADASYQANATLRKSDAREEARDEIAGQMRESFGALAQAAVAKSATLDSNAATIAALTASNAKLTATNAILVAALANRTTATPSAWTPSARTPPAPALPTAPDMTGMHTNSNGDSCPSKKWSAEGRWNFVEKQFCKNCNNMVNHVPANCPQLPGNEHIKLEMERYRAKRTARVATRAAARAAGAPPG